jgi:hypothetical protein
MTPSETSMTSMEFKFSSAIFANPFSVAYKVFISGPVELVSASRAHWIPSATKRPSSLLSFAL